VPALAPREEDRFDELLIDFRGSFGFSGIRRIIDNAASGISDVLPSWKDSVATAKDVCKLLRGGDYLPKLLERCFSTQIARHMWPTLKSFEGWMHEGRWGTVAFSIPELLRVQHTLAFGGDKALFLGGDAGDDTEDGSVFARSVDEAINSRTWWAWILMTDQVCRLMRKATVWVGCCPCHKGFLEQKRLEELPISSRKTLQRAR